MIPIFVERAWTGNLTTEENTKKLLGFSQALGTAFQNINDQKFPNPALMEPAHKSRVSSETGFTKLLRHSFAYAGMPAAKREVAKLLPEITLLTAETTAVACARVARARLIAEYPCFADGPENRELLFVDSVTPEQTLFIIYRSEEQKFYVEPYATANSPLLTSEAFSALVPDVACVVFMNHFHVQIKKMVALARFQPPLNGIYMGPASIYTLPTPPHRKFSRAPPPQQLPFMAGIPGTCPVAHFSCHCMQKIFPTPFVLIDSNTIKYYAPGHHPKHLLDFDYNVARQDQWAAITETLANLFVSMPALYKPIRAVPVKKPEWESWI